ncbi:MAG: putative bifunctional diguanylate cyclase/phosphodiesterase, partial [Asticcacaulis sp.]
LLDRKSFLKRAQEVLSQPGTYDLVVADLDRFRRLNEALGHGRADLVLTALGARLESAFPAEALPARLGEDEFAVLARKEGVRISERLRSALEQPLRIAGFDIHPSLSLGAVSAEGGENAPDAAELVRRAELAVEAAKSAGRGGVAAYGRALESDGLTKLALEADLRGAFARGEIEPYYQPIVRLQTGAVAGFEALVRWNHPRKGLIMPGDFLSLIEDMGMMNELGMLMMTKASHTFSRWLKHHPSPDGMFVSVNLSAGEIERYHLVEDVSRVIQESGLPRGALKLEVTESDIMRNPDQAALTLKALREVGAALAIDDFGTGFSSLSYLARLPFDTLKIDRYFVRTMETEENSAKIVRSVIALGRDLSLEVVAEGVENKAMAEQLLSVGCHFGQGFGYAPALSMIDAEVYLTESLLDGMAPIKSIA